MPIITTRASPDKAIFGFLVQSDTHPFVSAFTRLPVVNDREEEAFQFFNIIPYRATNFVNIVSVLLILTSGVIQQPIPIFFHNGEFGRVGVKCETT